MRVVVVDDHAVVRVALRRLLTEQPGLEVVADAATTGGALAAAGEHRPDVVVLGLPLPDGPPGAIMAALAAAVPGVRVVLVASSARRTIVLEALAAGAWGVVEDAAVETELGPAVREVAAGRRAVSAAVHADAGADPVSVLTPRERDVVRLLAGGHSNAEIAAELRISRRTAESHRAHVLRKLGAGTRAELVAIARRSGLAVVALALA